MSTSLTLPVQPVTQVKHVFTKYSFNDSEYILWIIYGVKLQDVTPYQFSLIMSALFSPLELKENLLMFGLS
jgi:hypothetical protein